RAARPDTVVVISPHHLHLEGCLGVVTSGRLAGDLSASESAASPGGRAGIDLECHVDRLLAREVLDALAAAGIPATGVSYGGNFPEEAVMPMDWGTLISLWYLGGRWEPGPQVVLVTPARDLEP